MTPEFIHYLEILLDSYKEQEAAYPHDEYWKGKVSATKIILKHAILEQAEQRIKELG